MKMAPRDRPKVKIACMRLLGSLKLDPARTKILGAFIDTYLKLNAEEMKQYERKMAKLPQQEREATMELMSSWERKGRDEGLQEGVQQGLHQGKEELLAIQLEQRFSTLPADITKCLDQLTPEQLNDLGRALFTFGSLSDLKNWLAAH